MSENERIDYRKWSEDADENPYAPLTLEQEKDIAEFENSLKQVHPMKPAIPFVVNGILSLLPGFGVLISLMMIFELPFLWQLYCIGYFVGMCGLCLRQQWALWLFAVIWIIWFYRHLSLIPNLWESEPNPEKRQIWTVSYALANLYELILFFSCVWGIWCCNVKKKIRPS